MAWLGDLVARRKQASERRLRTWEGWADDVVYLRMPYRIRRRRHDWTIWGCMQADVLARLKQNWPNARTYLWYRTPLASHLANLVSQCKPEETAGQGKAEHVFVFPSCEDLSTWAIVLSLGTLFHFSRAVFMLEPTPEDWKGSIERLVGLAQKTGGQLTPEDQLLLSTCRCLCYSADNDLVIGKVDVPVSTVIAAVEETAQAHGFELRLTQRHQAT